MFEGIIQRMDASAAKLRVETLGKKGQLSLCYFFSKTCPNSLQALDYLWNKGAEVFFYHLGDLREEEVSRLGLLPPVQDGSRLFKELNIQQTPTLLALGPKQNLLKVWAGESFRYELGNFVQDALDFYSMGSKSFVRPGKATFLEAIVWDGEKLLSSTGLKGYKRPSSMQVYEGELYVADAEGHQVITPKKCWGTGEPDSSYGGQSPVEVEQALSFPSGIAVTKEAVYVSLASRHQIARIEDSVEIIAGLGIAKSHDAYMPLQAAFNSPGALEILGDKIFVADKSGIRSMDLRKGYVATEYRWDMPLDLVAVNEHCIAFVDGKHLVTLDLSSKKAERHEHPLNYPSVVTTSKDDLFVGDRYTREVCRMRLGEAMRPKVEHVEKV